MDTEVRDRREDADQARIDGLTARAEAAEAEVERLRLLLTGCEESKEYARGEMARLAKLVAHDCRTTGERLAVQEDRLQILSDTMRRIVAEIGKRLDALEARA